MRVLSLTIIFIFVGCVNRAIQSTDDPTCKTRVVGRLNVQLKWTGKTPPLLIRKHNYEYSVLYGRIVKMEVDGVVFDQSRESMLFDPEPKFYPIDEVACLLDSTGNAAYGSIPKKYYTPWEFEIGVVPISEPDKKPLWIRLEANQLSSYCVSPDSYKVKEIIFHKGSPYNDLGFDLPDIVFEVKEGRSNYLGDFFLDDPSKDGQSIEILCHKGRRPSDAFVSSTFGTSGSVVDGAVSGAVGGLLIGLAKQATRLSHTITLADSSINLIYKNMSLSKVDVMVDTVSVPQE